MQGRKRKTEDKHKDKRKSQKLRHHGGVYDKEFVVERILDRRTFQNTIQYKVKWERYPESEATWEPLDHLTNVLDMVCDFNKELAAKSSTSSTSDQSKAARKGPFYVQKMGESASPTEPAKPSPIPIPTPTPTKASTRKTKSTKKQCAVGMQAELPNAPPSGSLETDVPKLIESGTKMQKEVLCKVVWEPRTDGVIPAPTTMSSALLKDRYPNLLLDFYEARLRFSTPNTNE